VNEATWRSCADPHQALAFLGKRASRRKLLLFACACCERVEHLLEDARSRSALAALRRAADGRADAQEMARELRDADTARCSALRSACVPVLGEAGFEQLSRRLSTGPSPIDVIADADARVLAATAVVRAAQAAFGHGTALQAADHAVQALYRDSDDLGIVPRERAMQCEMLRDLFGHPYDAVVLEPDWLTWNDSTAANLAQAIYCSRDFDRMPILADALEDSGCTDTAILEHCRRPGLHVRGCWLVDLLVGRK
jgi:hypothetical protein